MTITEAYSAIIKLPPGNRFDLDDDRCETDEQLEHRHEIGGGETVGNVLPLMGAKPYPGTVTGS